MLQDYSHLKDAEVVGVEVPSGVSEQPKSLDESITGAMNRARAAYADCEYSIGLESGIMPVPHTKSGYMELTACAIYDGAEFHLGLTSAWEFPDPEVMRKVVDEGMDLNGAAHASGMTESLEIGKAEGVVSIVTKGRVNRKTYTMEALRMALIHIDP